VTVTLSAGAAPSLWTTMETAALPPSSSGDGSRSSALDTRRFGSVDAVTVSGADDLLFVSDASAIRLSGSISTVTGIPANARLVRHTVEKVAAAPA
jgi:hypothetical protein